MKKFTNKNYTDYILFDIFLIDEINEVWKKRLNENVSKANIL